MVWRRDGDGGLSPLQSSWEQLKAPRMQMLGTEVGGISALPAHQLGHLHGVTRPGAMPGTVAPTSCCSGAGCGCLARAPPAARGCGPRARWGAASSGTARGGHRHHPAAPEGHPAVTRVPPHPRSPDPDQSGTRGGSGVPGGCGEGSGPSRTWPSGQAQPGWQVSGRHRVAGRRWAQVRGQALAQSPYTCPPGHSVG